MLKQIVLRLLKLLERLLENHADSRLSLVQDKEDDAHEVSSSSLK